MEVRPASVEDAETICSVVRRSISEICTLDHREDPTILGLWLANKTPETVARWLASPSNRIFVAVDGPAVLAAGCLNVTGEVTLNYVAPEARFRGASRALLAAMEACARGLGFTEVKLSSTATALRFYRDGGYVEDGPAREKHGLSTHPLRKPL